METKYLLPVTGILNITTFAEPVPADEQSYGSVTVLMEYIVLCFTRSIINRGSHD